MEILNVAVERRQTERRVMLSKSIFR